VGAGALMAPAGTGEAALTIVRVAEEAHGASGIGRVCLAAAATVPFPGRCTGRESGARDAP
jgi:hypothetical protein